MPHHRTYPQNGNARNTNTVPPFRDHEFSNAELLNAIQLLDQSMTYQNNQQVEGDNLRKIFRVNMKAGKGNYECSQQKSCGGNHLQF